MSEVGGFLVILCDTMPSAIAISRRFEMGKRGGMTFGTFMEGGRQKQSITDNGQSLLKNAKKGAKSDSRRRGSPRRCLHPSKFNSVPSPYHVLGSF